MPEAEAVEKQEEQDLDTKINKITCKGFKSFQQKTAVPFYQGLTAIVGENGSGKCVTGDTEVVLGDGRVRKIEDIVEEAVEKSAEKIDDGYISYEGDETVQSLNPRTLQIEERNVLAYAKREAPDEIVKVTTRSGRE
ncbi:MAG: AAA family ATPase, partial [Candidatus Nanohaloarchaea archaeon]